jgi:4-amino-4-deoxy-L-arabinose transferase-like glycosyltransferase
VTESLTAIPEKPSAGTAARIGWAVLILATLYVCYFSHLGAIGFVGPDEPRYAWIARDMAETGDWVTPRLYGKPWFEKPPLFYWGAAVCFKAFGVSETAARLPSAFSALLATLALAWLALRLYGAETARWLLLLLPTSVGMIGFSHAAATDMPFSAMLTIAMVCAAVVLGLTRNENSPILPRTPWLALILFGFFLGLAVLAKGPAAIILSGGAVFFWALFTKRWRDAFRLFHPAAIAAFCLTALPWYILCARRNPDFFRIFIIEHNFKRFLTPEFQHIQPFWFYLPVILLATFPWTILLISGIARAIRTSREALPSSSSVLFFLCWALFTILFFTISKSKLPGYILPALPAIMILISHHAVQLIRENKSPTQWFFALTGLAFILLGLGLQRYAGRAPAMQCVSPVCGITRIWVIAVIGGMVVGGLSFARKPQLSLLVAVLTTLLLVKEIDGFLPNLDPGVSAREATRAVKNIWPDFSAQRTAAWQLNRSGVYQLSFYLRTEIPEWQTDTAKPDWLFVKKEKRQDAMQLGFKCATYAIYPAVVPCRSLESLDRLSSLEGNRSRRTH